MDKMKKVEDVFAVLFILFIGAPIVVMLMKLWWALMCFVWNEAV